MVSGTTLTTSPSASAPSGTPVTLNASVFPPLTTGATGNYGQVEFLDNGSVLGTALVVTTSVDDGPQSLFSSTASLTTNALPPGDNTLTAQWSGTPNVPANASASVDFQVGTAPTVTTQSTDQTAIGWRNHYVYNCGQW